MRLERSAFFGVPPTGIVEAQASVRAAASDVTVVIILSVVLPAASTTDLVRAPLVERSMSTARTRVRLSPLGGEHVLLGGVGRKPLASLFEQLVIAHVGVVSRPPFGCGHRSDSAGSGSVVHASSRPRGPISTLRCVAEGVATSARTPTVAGVGL